LTRGGKKKATDIQKGGGDFHNLPMRRDAEEKGAIT